MRRDRFTRGHHPIHSDMRSRPALASLATALLLFCVFGPSPRSDAQEASTTQRINDETAALRARVQALEASPSGLPVGTLRSLRYTVEKADDIRRRHSDAARAWRARATRYLDRAEAGHDPFQEEAGKLTVRAYRSVVSQRDQGYAIYLPPNYDPSRRYPLYIALHGGSSNGNIFLGVVMGHNLDWETYDEHLYDEFPPRWTPDWIVVAPTGFGQIMWRHMGERDVFDVLDDVERHYPIDPDRVVLAGLSNGGVGAYAIGTRHAWRFSHVQAMAGAPSWLQYLIRTDEVSRQAVRPWSGIDLAENTINTRFFYYHGRRDGGPMRPDYVETFSRRMRELELPNNETWFDAGHDILYLAIRHGRMFPQLLEPRNRRPSSARVVSGDYRAARQHWLEIVQFRAFGTMGRAEGNVTGDALAITTENIEALCVHTADVPFAAGPTGEVSLSLDGQEVVRGPRESLGTRMEFVRAEDGAWRPGFFTIPEGTLRKRAGLSGPIMDAYFGRMVHVYGTQEESADGRPAVGGPARRAGVLVVGVGYRPGGHPRHGGRQPRVRGRDARALRGARSERSARRALGAAPHPRATERERHRGRRPSVT